MDILNKIITVGSGEVFETPEGHEYQTLEVTGLTLDEFQILYETMWKWAEEKLIETQAPNPFEVSGVFVKQDGRFRHAETREALDALTKAKILRKKFGNKYGMGSRYKMDDPGPKAVEIVKYESDWMDYEV